MSTDYSHDTPGHAGDGDHHPHVLPMSTYLATWGTLLVLTVVTVAISYVNLGHGANIAIALAIATIKATVVAAIFMHLKYDTRFHAFILSSAFIFLAVFICFTMFDTTSRGKCEAIEGIKVNDMKHPFAVATEAKEPATVIPQDTPGTNTLALPERFPPPKVEAAKAEHGE